MDSVNAVFTKAKVDALHTRLASAGMLTSQGERAGKLGEAMARVVAQKFAGRRGSSHGAAVPADPQAAGLAGAMARVLAARR